MHNSKMSMSIGKMITINGREGEIIGVIKDFNFKPVYQPIKPLVVKHRTSGGFLVIRATAGDIQRTLLQVQHCFQGVYGNSPFSYGFIDQATRTWTISIKPKPGCA